VADNLDSLTRPVRLEPLPEAECRSLLAANTLGRIGMTSGGLPVILPVRYRYGDGVIGFRTSPGTKLRSAESGEVLAFEIDGYDADANEGWSVLVQGRASVAPADHEILGAPGFHVRMGSELISGRRVIWG
jgi:nitroimidazol reductase NimA-like FMN-containing flavoprotein (pyridoxamine 5'-phosphate oxidase superfamily)